MILSICDTPKVMEVMNIVNIIITIIRIVVPIVLLFSLTFKLVNASTKGDEDAIASIKKKAVPSIIAAALIFIVPVLVNLIVAVSFPNSEYTKCIANISSEKIETIYVDKAEKLVSKAEETLNINDYAAAMNYMLNVKDKNKKESYEKRLSVVKELIDAQNKTNPNGEYKDYGVGKWVYHNAYFDELKVYYKSPLAFSEYVPEYAVSSGDSLPIIIWLHGSGGDVYSAFVGGGLIKVTEEWNTTGLKNIPAIMMAPQLNKDGRWNDDRASKTIQAMIKYAHDKYNANADKVVLMGHSYGGSGVYYVASANKDLFSKLVIMSGYASSPGASVDYFKSMPLKGYTEVLGNVDPNTGEKRKTGEIMKNFFKAAGHLNDLTIYNDATHAQIPKLALTEDLNNDNISDLIFWAFYEE